MAYGLYLILDQTRWYRDNYSSDDKLTGTIYTDINRTTAKNLTGYTIKIKMSKTAGPGRLSDRFNKSADIVVAANGTWSYAVTSGDIPYPGIYYVTAQISKSGTQESTLNRVEFHIISGATD